MALIPTIYEFDLTVRKKGIKEEYDYYGNNRVNFYDEKKELEVLEELKFNTLNAVEVIRKLLDYIQ